MFHKIISSSIDSQESSFFSFIVRPINPTGFANRGKRKRLEKLDPAVGSYVSSFLRKHLPETMSWRMSSPGLRNEQSLDISRNIGSDSVSTISIAISLNKHEQVIGTVRLLKTDTQFRRQGFATEVLDIAKKLMVDIGCEKSVLTVLASNESAIRLYKKCGYTEGEDGEMILPLNVSPQPFRSASG